jgi:hypothetical protein
MSGSYVNVAVSTSLCAYCGNQLENNCHSLLGLSTVFTREIGLVELIVTAPLKGSSTGKRGKYQVVSWKMVNITRRTMIVVVW